MKKKRNKRILCLTGYMLFFCCIIGIILAIAHLTTLPEDKSLQVSQETLKKTIQDYLLNEYKLSRDDYTCTKIRKTINNPKMNEVSYQSTIILKEPSTSFTIELTDEYSIVYDSFVDRMCSYYLNDYIAKSTPPILDYLKEASFHSYSFLATNKIDKDYISIELDLENKKFTTIVTELLKEKQPLDFKELLQNTPYVAFIHMELYTDTFIDENTLKQVEFDLKSNFDLIPQTYTLSIEQVDFSSDSSFTDDKNIYFYHQFRGKAPNKTESIL